jgi:hypothetical protein
MSTRNVKRIIKALITDPKLQKSFFANKDKTLEASGLKLTAEEFRALKTIRRSDVKVGVRIKLLTEKKYIAEGVSPVVIEIKPGGPTAYDDR